MKIRRYRSEDQDRVIALHRAGLDQTGSDGGAGPWDGDLTGVAEVHLEAEGELLVDLVDGTVLRWEPCAAPLPYPLR